MELGDEDYTALADFRLALRRFVRFTKQAAAKAGLTPQQHQALLAIRAAPDRELLIGDLARNLLLRPHSASELADRLEKAGLARRLPDPNDARRVRIVLSDEGARRLAALAKEHRNELSRMKPILSALVARL